VHWNKGADTSLFAHSLLQETHPQSVKTSSMMTKALAAMVLFVVSNIGACMDNTKDFSTTVGQTSKAFVQNMLKVNVSSTKPKHTHNATAEGNFRTNLYAIGFPLVAVVIVALGAAVIGACRYYRRNIAASNPHHILV